MQFRRGLQERQPVSPLPDAFAHIENNVREKGSLFSGRGIGGVCKGEEGTVPKYGPLAPARFGVCVRRLQPDRQDWQ